MLEANENKGDLLIVDDMPANLRLLSNMLAGNGYKVRSVISGSMALTAAQSAQPDLMLLDINMPQMDGFEVCRLMKADEKMRTIPIIFISALDDVQDKVKALSAGGVDYITKPFHIEEVLARVATHIALRKLQKELLLTNQALEYHIHELSLSQQKLQEAKQELECWNHALEERVQERTQELANAYLTTLEGWARALELRDYETRGHCQRVTQMTLLLARALGFNEEEIIHIQRGALLHDIGKMGIPDQVLLKPGPLSPEEWEIMRMHPVYAMEMLSPIQFLSPALDIPHYHHERWDGNGYPDGLKEEQIPLPARLFAVIDVWDALTSDRPYRPAWPAEKAYEYIQEQSGKAFDPRVAAIFLDNVNRFAEQHF